MLSFSGGKDSTALLLMMLEKGIEPGEIVFFNTGWEFPEMLEHIRRVEEYIGRRIVRLQPEKPFDYWMFEHKLTTKNRCGYGFPTIKSRWCTRIKLDTLTKFWVKMGKPNFYLGIAYDEQHRIKGRLLKNNKKFPLVDWKITEKQALQYCYSRGFDWGGLYNYFRRVSCWCCPFRRLSELRNLRRFYPNLWQRLMEMEERSWNKFRQDYSVFDLEERFKQEESQLKLQI